MTYRGVWASEDAYIRAQIAEPASNALLRPNRVQ